MRMARLGASGCGKSVTLKCIAGIMTPDRGHIILDGETLFDSEKHIDLPPQKRRAAAPAAAPKSAAARRRKCAASGWKGWRKSTRPSSPADSSARPPGERTTAAFNILADKCLCYK